MADAPLFVAGGGIGGLTAALALAHVGRNVVVLEQAPVFTEAGAGIQISPNASRVLIHLGLRDALEAVAFLPEAVEVRDWRSGRVITTSPLGDAALQNFGSPYYHVHRGDLLGVLHAAAAAHEAIELRLDTSVERFEASPDGVGIALDDGVVGAGLIGADGIHSRVRARLFGDEPARFTGNVAWRLLVPTQRLPEGLVRPAATAWWGPGAHFVHYYVRSGSLVNCVCVVERDDWREESWTSRGEHEDLQADFADWHSNVRTLIDAADPDACFRWALFDRTPMPRWSKGPVTLLGDACHPTLPFMAQGGAMAIEDAAVLARSVAALPDVAQAFRRYEVLRRDRTAGIQNGSRRNASIFHMRGVAAKARNLAAGRAGAGAMNWLYSYDPLAVPLEAG